MRLKFFLLLLIFGLTLSAHAVDVHKWVDENGITHYSDEKPDSDSLTTTVIEVPANYVTSDEENYYSVVKQWERLHQERLALKQLKLEQAKLNSVKYSESVPVVVNLDPDRKTYVPAYPYHFAKRFHRFPNDNVKDFKFKPDYPKDVRSKGRRIHPKEDFSGLRIRIK